MSERTSNYNLVKLGAGDALSTEDYAVFGSNLELIDRIMAANGRRPGSTSTPVTDPASAPELDLDTTQGNLPAATTIYYRYAYVDSIGLETAASPISSVTTPAPLVAPAAPGLTRSASGGSLFPGNYHYLLTAYETINTNETKGISPSIITLATTGSTWIIDLELPALPSGADGFNVYRRGPGESEYSYLGSIDMGVATPPTTYEDDGSATPNCTRRPPISNQTSRSNNVTIGIPGATPVVDTDAAFWRIYRSYNLTDWTSSKLHDVVEETTEGSGIITPEYLDLGYATTRGVPLAVTEMSAAVSKIDLTDYNEVDGVLPVSANVVPFQLTFAMPGDVAVAEGTFVWEIEHDYLEVQYVRAAVGRGQFCNGGTVVVDVLKEIHAATPTWDSIFDATFPTIADGEHSSPEVVPNDPSLVKGDRLVVDITGVTTALVQDLVVNIYCLVRETSSGTTSPSGILGL